MNQTIREAKALFNIEAVSKELLPGLKVRRGGLKGKCPFHDEKKASFYVYGKSQRFICYGCGAGGDVVDLVARINSLRLVEAAEWMMANLKMAKGAEKPWTPPELQSDEERESWLDVVALNERVLAMYKDRLWAKGGREARDILEARGALSNMIWEPGFAPYTDMLPDRFPDYHKVLIAAGVVSLVDDDLHDVLRGRMVWPIKCMKGHTRAFVGRVVTASPSAPKFMNTLDSVAYHKGCILYGEHVAARGGSNDKMAWLVEGYLDVQAVVAAGMTPGLALGGTAFTVGHCHRLKLLGINSVHYLADGDKAGFMAAERVDQIARAEGLEVAITALPHGEDPGSILSQGGRDALLDLVKV